MFSGQITKKGKNSTDRRLNIQRAKGYDDTDDLTKSAVKSCEPVKLCVSFGFHVSITENGGVNFGLCTDRQMFTVVSESHNFPVLHFVNTTTIEGLHAGGL